MAIVDRIFFHSSDMRTRNTMTAYIKLKPAGEVTLDVPVPEKFFNLILNLAQTAADHNEARMQAEILGERENHEN